MSHFDRQLLNVLQSQLPISKRPFAEMAEKLGCDEKTVLERLNVLKKEGYLRRVGPFFDSHNLGYEGVLVAAKIQKDRMAEVAEKINAYAGITHNYEREGEYNLWFTLLSASKEQEKNILDEIEKIDGVEKIMPLKSRRRYKVNVQFNLKQVK